VLPRRIPCPSCQKTLTVQTVHEPWLTCPHCLAKVKNPTQADPASTAITSAQPPRSASSGSVCPACGAAVESGWAHCPHCSERLRPGRTSAESPPPVDVDVRRDVRSAWTALCLFLILGGIGIGLVQFSHGGPAFGVLGFLIPVMMLLIGGILAMVVRPQSTGTRVLVRVLGAVAFTIVGAVVAMVVTVILVFAACIAALGSGKMLFK
jgi:hypothetical protein